MKRMDKEGSKVIIPVWYYDQAATIPYRRRGDLIEVLVISTPSRRRWITPKGVVDPGETPLESARRETLEEAGVEGNLAPEPLGTFEFRKWKGTCVVTVFLMEVTRIRDRWPEDDFRLRAWMPIEEAQRRCGFSGLRALIAEAADRLKKETLDLPERAGKG